MSLSTKRKHSNGAEPPVSRRRPRLGNFEDLEAIASIVRSLVASFNESANPGSDRVLLYYVDAMIEQRHRRGVDSPPHVIIWLDLKKEELDDVEIGLALAARCLLDGRIPAAFECTVDVYWRFTGEFVPMLGRGKTATDGL